MYNKGNTGNIVVLCCEYGIYVSMMSHGIL